MFRSAERGPIVSTTVSAPVKTALFLRPEKDQGVAWHPQEQQRFGRYRFSLRISCRGQEALQERTWIMSPHQRLADQGRMGSGRDDPPNVIGGSNPAFADDGAVTGYFGGQSFSHI